ncbi:DUF2917 domain-containing protein [Inhella proteolytica]|uniref:DUF2917 domain-containing protein n=1 Tax=Inhella proteolytica TaxID=2795029 RepID=A0A931NG97_9BURK|nr:DUF2917 domain-containing protein [Inhella proteolytica]MBH9576468.1 DUF2917 domain-containing protein [Inhella proteolytica]
MWIETQASRLTLQPGQSARLLAALHTRVRSAAGTLWLTLDEDPRDIVLGPQESFEVDRCAGLLVCALGGPAELEWEQP